MCLAIPMKIVELCEKDIAVVAANDSKTKISTSLIKNPQVGDFVIVHAGYAIEKLDQKEADLRIELFKELSELNLKA